MTTQSGSDKGSNGAYVTLTDHATGKQYDLPVYEGTMGPKVIDVRSLYRDTGYFTYDPSFMSTASCESKITFIDGDKGQLLHRGYSIEELAENSTYLEVAYLLLEGKLPTAAEYKGFDDTITAHTMLHQQLPKVYEAFRRDAHPMAVMVGVVGALSAFYHDSIDFNDPRQRIIAIHRLIAKIPTIASYAFKYTEGQPFMYPQDELSYAADFLYLCFATPTRHYEVSPVLARAMDRIMILHADHEQNASTSTVRIAGSSGANPFACIAAGIASLWGPAHGGANEEVINMLTEIGTKDRIPDYLNKVHSANHQERLMGFGHRVYKNYDPRAAVLRKSAHEVLEELGVNDHLLEVAMELERRALEEDYFKERKLFPNVDFYSGILLKAMGFPTSMFTAVFAVSRTIGWIAQWKEMVETPDIKIARPRQLFKGEMPRPYVPMDKR